MTKNYMYGDRTSQSQRKQRQDEQVELRRVRTEEMLKRKREAAETKLIEEYSLPKEKLYSTSSLDEIYNGAYEFRLVLSGESNPPIQEVLDSGIVNRVVELINLDYYSSSSELVNNIRVECAWILTNICTGTHEQTKAVVQTDAPTYLVKMLSESNEAIVDQAVWVLGNIAGDCEEFRDILVRLGCVKLTISKIQQYANDSQQIKILRNLMWLLGNLNRGRNPAPLHENMIESAKIFEQMCVSNDADLVSTCFWGSSYICDVDATITDIFLQSALFYRVCELLKALAMSCQTNTDEKNDLVKICSYSISPIIRTLGNVLTGTDEQTDVILKSGVIDYLPIIFYNFNSKKLPRIRKEICWSISNITAGTPEQIKFIIDKNTIPMLIDAMANYEVYIKKEAVYALHNISSYAKEVSLDTLEKMVTSGIIEGIKKCIKACDNYPEILNQVLDICKDLLEAGESQKKNTGENRIADMMVTEGLADMVEDLQEVRNSSVAKKAYNIIVEHFGGEDEQYY